MSFTANTGAEVVHRSDLFSVNPLALKVDWRKNLSRGGTEPPVDDALIGLARDMAPNMGNGASETGSSGQLNPIICRALPDRTLEVVGGFRRLRAALYLRESGECPDFEIKYVVRKISDSEAALQNVSENVQREDPKPVQLAYAIRSLNTDYCLSMKEIAGRLKRSEAWCRKLVDLVNLAPSIQAAVADGTVPVMAALEMATLPASEQIATFDAVKDSGGKVSVAKVREQKPPAVGVPPKPKALTVKQIEVVFVEAAQEFTDSRVHIFAEVALAVIQGKTEVSELYKAIAAMVAK